MMDITKIVSASIVLIFTIITSVVIPYIKSKLDAEKYVQLTEWVSVAVKAAEQLYKGSGNGIEKKAYVQSFLAKKGYEIDSEAINNLIEAEVYKISTAS